MDSSIPKRSKNESESDDEIFGSFGSLTTKAARELEDALAIHAPLNQEMIRDYNLDERFGEAEEGEYAINSEADNRSETSKRRRNAFLSRLKRRRSKARHGRLQVCVERASAENRRLKRDHSFLISLVGKAYQTVQSLVVPHPNTVMAFQPITSAAPQVTGMLANQQTATQMSSLLSPPNVHPMLIPYQPTVAPLQNIHSTMLSTTGIPIPGHLQPQTFAAPAPPHPQTQTLGHVVSSESWLHAAYGATSGVGINQLPPNSFPFAAGSMSQIPTRQWPVWSTNPTPYHYMMPPNRPPNGPQSEGMSLQLAAQQSAALAAMNREQTTGRTDAAPKSGIDGKRRTE